jgi:transketolase
MENNILWHYRYPHEGEEYDSALRELYEQMPPGVTDMYSKREAEA